jgi:hypothetical protein
MSERDEVINFLIVRARASNRLKTFEDFALFCDEVASCNRWVGEYFDKVKSMRRTVRAAWKKEMSEK